MFKHKIEKLMEDKLNQGEFSGVVLIQQGDKELFSGAYGYAHRGWQIQNTVDTRFRIASISKLFTAASILQLVDEGKFSLDTQVVEYLGLKDTKIPGEVTLYHLLTHTSGIADYYNEQDGEEAWEEMWRERPIYNIRKLKDYLSLFIDRAPVFKAGERYEYNGAGYILLGMMIEKATGMDYFDYVRKHIFQPLGLKDTDFVAIDGVEEKVAEGYDPVLDESENMIGWKKNVFSVTPEAASDGGATSTVYELTQFIQALRKGELLSEEMTKMILKPHVMMEKANGFRGYQWRYGFANMLILDQEENIIRGGHTGEEVGVSCRLYYYPSLDIDFVILGNQSGCAGLAAWEIHDLIMESFGK